MYANYTAVVYKNAFHFIIKEKRILTNPKIPEWEKFLGIFTFNLLNIIVELITQSLESALKKLLDKETLELQNFGSHNVQWADNPTVDWNKGGFIQNFYCVGNEK